MSPELRRRLFDPDTAAYHARQIAEANTGLDSGDPTALLHLGAFVSAKSGGKRSRLVGVLYAGPLEIRLISSAKNVRDHSTRGTFGCMRELSIAPKYSRGEETCSALASVALAHAKAINRSMMFAFVLASNRAPTFYENILGMSRLPVTVLPDELRHAPAMRLQALSARTDRALARLKQKNPWLNLEPPRPKSRAKPPIYEDEL